MNFAQQIPALDQVLCDTWPQLPTDFYQKLDFYLVKAEQEARKNWQTWTNLITDTVPWQPNMATTMRAVLVEDAPIQRAEARPRYITSDPLEDIFMVRERIAEARLQWQDFTSPYFQFLPAFQDFMKGNLVPTRKTIERQIMVYEDLFYRTFAWDHSPNVYIAGAGKVDAPVGLAADGTSNKTQGWLQAALTGPTAVGYLTYQEMFNAASVFTQEVGATPYSGDGLPDGDNKIIDNKYVLLCSNEAWMQFTNDPWVKENRPLSMNIINSAFKGPLFDTILGRIERYPMRYSVDANMNPTIQTPEVSELNPNAPDYGRTKPNLNYAQIGSDTAPNVGAPIEVAWLIGGKNYKRISSGPPPEFFAGSASDPQKIAGMQWNGQVYPTKNFLIPCKDANGNITQKMNDRGRYMKFMASLILGCLPLHTFNVMPIIFRRRRGVTTTAVA